MYSYKPGVKQRVLGSNQWVPKMNRQKDMDMGKRLGGEGMTEGSGREIEYEK